MGTGDPGMEFMREPSLKESEELLPQWSWLIPRRVHPIFLSAFGDWVLGEEDGSLWLLSVLEGVYEKLANDSAEFNALNKSDEWNDQKFIEGWWQIAKENGIVPEKGECIGWKVHPLIGGEFSVSNLQIFSMRVYQSLMSQLHSRLQGATVENP